MTKNETRVTSQERSVIHDVLNWEYVEVVEWLQAEACKNPFAEVGIKLVLHAGEISRTEYLVINKKKPTHSGGNNVPNKSCI